ncbi:MFS transporter [Pseudonocardia sp. WMMC193]|uniref:MFS transporter n=1 Tax=Pseudonocardia sp. WMMC193 TaxID=2911965 RepID=UPI001F00F3AE|nr:MFS transporter [Pseudonocardia sp. WMMC193]MCF7553597.1 MFS transporter [Pseudonocardia sp. WMMC193]
MRDLGPAGRPGPGADRLGDRVGVRGAGTLVGALCAARPQSDAPTAAVALRAEVLVRSATGTRTVPAERFLAGPMTPDLAPDELVVGVRIPACPDGTGYVKHKFAESSWPVVTAAAVPGRVVLGGVAMVLMAAGSLLIGVAPTHAQIGTWAAAILVFARLAQGLAHGGEIAASYTYIAEIAPRERRGLWSTSLYVSVTAGIVLASLIGAAASSLFGTEALQSWAWRIPFLIGGLLGLVALYLRRTLPESEAFTGQDGGEDAGSPAAAAASRGTLRDLLRGLAENKRSLARIGVAFVLLSYPLMAALNDSAWRMFGIMVVALFFLGAFVGIMPAYFAELFPTSVRASGIGVPYSFIVAIFGGTAPYVLTWLSSHDLVWVFSVYSVVLVLIGVVTTLLSPETKGRVLE